MPLVVLIDDQSASASEIFAAAIRDNRRGSVIGQRSFGKGSVQGIFPLGYAGAGIRLTTAKFYSPAETLSAKSASSLILSSLRGKKATSSATGCQRRRGPAKAIEAARGQIARR